MLLCVHVVLSTLSLRLILFLSFPSSRSPFRARNRPHYDIVATTMGAKVSRDDFEWSYTEEPHATRRKEILGLLNFLKKINIYLRGGNSYLRVYCRPSDGMARKTVTTRRTVKIVKPTPLIMVLKLCSPTWWAFTPSGAGVNIYSTTSLL